MRKPMSGAGPTTAWTCTGVVLLAAFLAGAAAAQSPSDVSQQARPAPGASAPDAAGGRPAEATPGPGEPTAEPESEAEPPGCRLQKRKLELIT